MLIVFLCSKESICYGRYFIFLLLQCIRDLSLIDKSQKCIRAIRKNRAYSSECAEDIIGVIDILNQEDTFWSFIPLLAARDQFSHKGLDNSCKECHAFHQPVFGSMTNKRVLIVEKVEHAKESYFIELNKLFVDIEEIFIFVSCQSPEMGEALDRCLLIWCTVSAERSLHSIGKLIREVFAEANDEIYNFGVHMWKVKQRP